MSFRTQTNFDLGLLSLDLISPKLIGARARLASWHQHTYRICVPWPSEPKQILTGVYFPSAYFLQNLLGLVSLILAAPTSSIVQRIIPLTFWTQTYFDLGLLSLGLISPKIIGDRFTQPHSTNIVLHIGFVSLGLLDPNKF